MVQWFKVGQEALGISFLSPSSKQMIGLAMIQVNRPIKTKLVLCRKIHQPSPRQDSGTLSKDNHWSSQRSVLFLVVQTSHTSSGQSVQIFKMGAQVCAALWIKVILLSTLRWTAHATSIIQLLNSLLFLCHGRHSSVSFRVIILQTRLQLHACCRIHELRMISHK